MKAFYSSLHDGIITDKRFMSLPIDEHMVHRGHAVFDTLTVVNGRGYLLDRHVRRIVDSAEKARIELPKTPE
jgi:branched-subunit amino acid aminotransferase/4-amino-4-deoxychorismate lyase